ncbi:MAG TPA: hypothetical protein DCX06_09305 [Opitutae bacterium]|nr:hypothetical protein [Opitutae bacterium]
MARENFTAKVRNQIEKSAGHQCSFPGCNRRTNGPGPAKTEYISASGYAAHIYSASKGGPRGQGGLDSTELKMAENGIWLCGNHAKLIDNCNGERYPSETLHSYKALHEARVLLEHEGLYPPVGWIHEVSLIQSPLFHARQTLQLSKLNLIYGKNGTGKTAIIEWIQSLFDCEKIERWIPADKSMLNLQMTLLNPAIQHLEMRVEGKEIKYFIGGNQIPFVPIGFRIFKPTPFDYSIVDDSEMIAKALGLPIPTIDALIEEVNRFPHAKAKNLRFEFDTDDEGNTLKERVLFADIIGTRPNLVLRGNLSGSETENILLELATAAARLSGKYCPTLLILDECIRCIFDGFFDFYSNHLLNPLNQFQTLMCIPEYRLDLDNVRWNGWQVIRTHGTPPNASLSQDLRTTQT